MKRQRLRMQWQTVILPDQPTLERKWHQLWWVVWKNRNEAAFQSILGEADHSLKRGLTWLFIIPFIGACLYYPISVIFLQQSLSTSTLQTVLLTLWRIIWAPILGIMITIVITGIIHGTAKLFKGSGQFSDLMFCYAAIQAPILVISQAIRFFPIPTPEHLSVIYIPNCVIGLIGLYELYLLTKAIKIVEHVESGQAIGIVILPYVVIFSLAMCAIFGLAISAIK